jgi:uncharacterized C2H2 Zn-finger protein
VELRVMVHKTCPKCSKVFNRSDAYEYHINKKYPCKPIKDIEDNKKSIEE